MSGPILAVEDLTKSFGPIVVADGVSLSIPRGECHGIIGPNGAGKTTLFDLITGFQPPDRGVVTFDGQDVTGMGPDRLARRGLVRTFQIVSPFERMTVRENLHSVYTGGLGSAIRVSDPTKARAGRLLETLSLARVADQPAGAISGGQQKLLELGRALMLEPACLLLDEPTAGVNPRIQATLLDVLRTVNDRGTTVVVIEHDMSVIGDLAERVTVMDEGRVIAQGDFGAVTDTEPVREAYIGRPPAAGSDADDGSTAPSQSGSRSRDEMDSETAESTDRASAVDRAMTSSAANTLVARDVVAGYGRQIVIDGVSIRSRPGVTCVFGPNGSGKSTLLKTLAGVVPANAGAVTYGGEEITDWPPHEIVAAGITTVPQREHVFGGLSVRENLQLGGTTVPDAVVGDRMAAVLERFPELQRALDTRAGSLSGGEQVMLALARAMMSGADVYLLDEPLSGLAPSVVDEVIGVIQRLVEGGTHVVLVEQHVRECLGIADHVYVLSQGQLQFDGTPAALRDEDELVDLYLGLQ